MRKVTSHQVHGLNEYLTILAPEEAGHGGGCHYYQIQWEATDDTVPHNEGILIPFQNGPIQEAGVNGISNEALLAILEDRLTGFQRGQYACRENAIALTKIQEAMLWLQKRTLDRVDRGVEGTSIL